MPGRNARSKSGKVNGGKASHVQAARARQAVMVESELPTPSNVDVPMPHVPMAELPMPDAPMPDAQMADVPMPPAQYHHTPPRLSSPLPSSPQLSSPQPSSPQLSERAWSIGLISMHLVCARRMIPAVIGSRFLLAGRGRYERVCHASRLQVRQVESQKAERGFTPAKGKGLSGRLQVHRHAAVLDVPYAEIVAMCVRLGTL